MNAIENATRSYQKEMRDFTPTPSVDTDGGNFQSKRLTIAANNTKSLKMFESRARINTSSTDASSYNIHETSGNAIKLIDKN